MDMCIPINIDFQQKFLTKSQDSHTEIVRKKNQVFLALSTQAVLYHISLLYFYICMNIIYGTCISEQISLKRSHHTRSIVNNNGN